MFLFGNLESPVEAANQTTLLFFHSGPEISNQSSVEAATITTLYILYVYIGSLFVS